MNNGLIQPEATVIFQAKVYVWLSSGQDAH